MIAKTKIRMDLDRTGLVRRLDAVQGDTNTRVAELVLFVNGLEWTIPEDVAVQVRYRKPDGTGGIYDTLPDGTKAWELSENIVSVTLAPQMLTVSGEVKLQVQLLQGSDSLATFTILLHVQADPAAGILKSSDYVNMRDWLLQQLEEAIAAADIPVGSLKLEIGTVTTLAPGHAAWAAVTQTDGKAVLDLGIPTGYSPTLGVDYWTDAEQDQIQAQLQAELDRQVQEAMSALTQLTPEFAQSIGECTDASKLYVLPDGYLYAYMTRTTYTEPEELYDPAAATLNVRHSGTPGTVVSGNAYVMTDYIPVNMAAADPVQLRITCDGFNASASAAPQFQKIAYYNSSKTCLGSRYILSSATNGIQLKVSGADTTVDVGYISGGDKESYYEDIAYVRVEVKSVNSPATDADRSLIVSIVDANAGGSVTKTGWLSTGHAFVPADYEDRIAQLETVSQRHSEKIDSLQMQTENTVLIPSYWQEHLREKIAAVHALQEAGGKDCFSFVALADMHESANLGKCSGALAEKVMDSCQIKYALVLGDTATRSSVTAAEDMEASFDRAEQILKPIRDRALQTQGNHDGSWGDDGTVYYIRDFTPEKMHSYIYRKVGMIPGVVADDTGSAYYVDDNANRVRYIMLNGHNLPYEENEDGTAKYSTFRNGRFGQSQYDWLVSQALKVADGWAIVIGTHAPLNDSYSAFYGGTEGEHVLMRNLLKAYNERSVFAGSFAGTMNVDAVEVTADFTDACGEVVAAVAGHVHADTAGIWEIPVITLRCDAAEENTDELKSQRVAGTVTEQSFDIFTVNRKTRTIYATKIGAGEDRSLSY